MNKELINWNKLHHAYLICGRSKEDWWQEIEAKSGFAKTGNPDALDLEVETFGIDDSKELGLWAIKRPFGGRGKMAVISARSFSHEAQGALLKLFEEPPGETYFFVLTANIGAVLPTLVSRMQAVIFGNEAEDRLAKKFLRALIGERLETAALLAKDKDKKIARDFVSGILAELRHAQIAYKKQALPPVLQAARFLSSRSPSIKMILEHLALVLPQNPTRPSTATLP